MESLLFLIFVLILLYFLSRTFIKKLFAVLWRATEDKDEAARILGIIFLPGTFVHEISHFLMALILFVPAGDLDLMPEAGDGGIRLGKVSIAKADFIRGSLIGLAPIFAGGAIMFWLITFALGHLSVWWIAALSVLAIFEITHTMFSSKKDIVAVLELAVFIAVVSGALIILKIYTPFEFLFSEIVRVGPFIQKLSYFLLIPLGLELLFLAFFRKIRV